MLNLKDIHSNIKDELQKQQSDFIQLIYNTTPVDRQRVEKVICKIYESLHLNTPREIIWADSPLQAGVLLEILKSDLCLQSLLEMNEIDAIRGIEEKISKWPEGPVLNAFFETGRDRLKVFERELFKSFDNQLALMIRQKVDKEASKFLHKHLEKFIQEKVTEEIGREIFQSFEDYFTYEINLDDFDKGKLQDQEARHKFYRGCFLNGVMATQIGTQKQYHLRTLQIPLFFHYIGRLFLYRFFQEINLFNFDLAKGLVQIYESCGPFWFPFPNTVICSERPSIVCFDLQKKLHRDFAPALEWKDGFGLYRYHGVFLPKKYILRKPNEISARQVLNLKDISKVIPLMEKCSVSKFENLISFKLISDSSRAKLLEFELNKYPVRILQYQEIETGKERVVEVPRSKKSYGDKINIRNANQVLAWFLGEKIHPSKKIDALHSKKPKKSKQFEIERLTLDQESRFEEFRNKWIGIGLSTEPADRKRAEQGALKAYEAARVKPPKEFIWTGSPLQGCVQAAIRHPESRTIALTDLDSNEFKCLVSRVKSKMKYKKLTLFEALLAYGNERTNYYGHWIWNEVGKQEISQKVKKEIWHQVKKQILDPVFSLVHEKIFPHVSNEIMYVEIEKLFSDSMWHSLNLGSLSQIQTHVRHELKRQVDKVSYCNISLSALAGFDYFQEVCRLDFSKMKGWFEIAQSAFFWWWQFPEVVIFSERPVELHLDEKGALHRDGGAAILYPDGWGIYAWHGMMIPKKFVLQKPDKIDLMDILNEKNPNIKKSVIEKCGLENLFRRFSANVITYTSQEALIEFICGGRKVRAIYFYSHSIANDEHDLVQIPISREEYGENAPLDLNNLQQVLSWYLQNIKKENEKEGLLKSINYIRPDL